MDFKTINNLSWYISPLYLPYDEDGDWKCLNMGTCIVHFGETEQAYEIFGIVNTNKGNGHLEDVLQWFEYMCKEKGKYLIFTHFENQNFKKHLIEKRGFESYGKNNAIKIYTKQ